MGTSEVNRNSLLGKRRGCHTQKSNLIISSKGYLVILYWPKKNGLVCERRSSSFTISHFLPTRWSETIVAQTSLSWHWDNWGQVLAATSVLGEAAGNLWGSRFLCGNTHCYRTKHYQELLAESHANNVGCFVWIFSFTFLNRWWEKLNFSSKTSKEVLQEEQCILQTENRTVTSCYWRCFVWHILIHCKNHLHLSLLPDQYWGEVASMKRVNSTPEEPGLTLDTCAMP